MAAGSTFSRRVSEFLGVVLFAVALIWLIALVTYEPTDPTWFFNAGRAGTPANFIGRVGRVPRRAVVPAVRLRRVPRARSCSASPAGACSGAGAIDAVYTKIVGAVLLFACLSALLTLALGKVSFANGAGGYLGDRPGERCSPTRSTAPARSSSS